MNELAAGIYTTLAGNAGVTTAVGGTAIHHGTAPQGASYPYIVFSLPSEVDNYALAQQVSADFLVTVKAVTKSPAVSPSRKKAGEIDAAVKTALNDASIALTGKTLLSIRRQSGFAYDEQADGVIYTHIGGDYRCMTTP